MEMEKTVMELVGGLKWEILFMLFQCMLVGYIILTIKAFIVNEFAYRKFRNSLFISVGVMVRHMKYILSLWVAPYMIWKYFIKLNFHILLEQNIFRRTVSFLRS